MALSALTITTLNPICLRPSKPQGSLQVFITNQSLLKTAFLQACVGTADQPVQTQLGHAQLGKSSLIAQ